MAEDGKTTAGSGPGEGGGGGSHGPIMGRPPAEQRSRRRWLSNTGKRRLLMIGGIGLAVLLAVGSVLWLRCGLKGCPDVDMLKGYMPDQASVVVDRDGEEVSKLFVERRTVVTVDSMPEHLLDAFVAIEDRRFFDHGGVDWRRVLGALAKNVKAGSIEEGSSTITMQLARNVFPEQLPANQKTLWRKLGEAWVAREIEKRYTKREILELYLNQIYFGSGAYGIQAAADEYYAKPVAKLTLAESALLAALPRAPSRLNPRANREAALEGRELVLQRMAEQGLITEAERAEAAEAKLVLKERKRDTAEVAPYFVEAVRRQLEEDLGSAIYTEGYTIHTTLDLDAQRAAERELTAQLSAMEAGRFGSYPHDTYNGFHADSTNDGADETPYLQGAVVIMDARTGDVLALIGGRDYDDSEFNRATQARRQPGSAFKPFVYAAAVNAGYSPAHRLMDRPLRYVMDDGRVWEPGNYDGGYAGVVTMRQALTQSKNVATVRLANEVGMSRVLGMAEQMGLGDMPSNPSVVLGTAEVTPLQLTSAYAAFATLGQRPEPRFVMQVTDRDGRVVWQQGPEVHGVIDPAVAFVTTSMLQDVVDRGTGTGVRGAGFSGPAAGKTGTTQDAADVWFVGFTPELVGTIWIGLDRRQRILRNATGGEIAAPLWGRIMRQFAGASAGWNAPSGVEQVVVDEMGSIMAAGCTPQGATHTEYFVRGTAGAASCYQDAYAYNDTLGSYYDQYDYGTWGDTLGTEPADSTGDAGWWERMKRRFSRDSARVATPPTQPPPVAVPAQPTDTTRPRPSEPTPIGRPVTPDSTQPRPDSVRPPPPPPPDTNAVPAIPPT